MLVGMKDRSRRFRAEETWDQLDVKLILTDSLVLETPLDLSASVTAVDGSEDE